MSGNVVAWVYENYPVRCAADRTRKIVLSEVAEAANRDLENGHPGIRRIATDWHLGRSTVIGALKELVAEGWLEITEDGRGRNATVYRVCREVLDPKVQEIDLSDEAKGPGIPAERARDSSQRARDSVCSLYPSSVSTQEPPARATQDPSPLLALFEIWWKEYPRKVNKKNARDKYLARVRAGARPDDLLWAARHYAHERDGEPETFTQHAATFLSADDGPWREALERSRRAPEAEPDDLTALALRLDAKQQAWDALTEEEREAERMRDPKYRAWVEGAG